MSNKKLTHVLHSFLKEEYNTITSSYSHENKLTLHIFELYHNYPLLVSQRLFHMFDIESKGFLTMRDYVDGYTQLYLNDTLSKINFFFDFFDYNKDGHINHRDIIQIMKYIHSYKTKEEDDQLSELDYDGLITDINRKSIDIKALFNYFRQNNAAVFIIFYAFFYSQMNFSAEIIELVTGHPFDLKSFDAVYFGSLLHPTMIIQNFDREFMEYINTMYYFDFDYCNKGVFSVNDNDNEEDNDLEELNSFENDLIRMKIDTLPSVTPSHQSTKNCLLSLNVVPKYDQKNSSKYLQDSSINASTNISSTTVIPIIASNRNDKDIGRNDDVINACIISNHSNHRQHIAIKYMLPFIAVYKFKKDIRKFDRLIPLKGLYFLNQINFKDNDDNEVQLLSIINPDKNDISISFDFPDEKHKLIDLITKTNKTRNWYDYYSPKQLLSNGKMGEVELAINKQTNQKVIMKTLDKTTFRNYLWEIEISKFIMKNPHKNIIKCYDIFDYYDKVIIIYEYIEFGSLQNLSSITHHPIDSNLIFNILKQIIEGINFLHHNGIIHRDIKPANIMLDLANKTDYTIKIIDFGLSRMMFSNAKASELVGTLMFIAPEIFIEKSYSFTIDLWSLGIMMYCIQCGAMPFGIELFHLNYEIVSCVTNNELMFPQQSYNDLNVTKQRNLYVIVNDYITKLLEKDQAKRLTVFKLFKEINKQRL